MLKPPITYYGGKQNLLKTILPLIPEHKCYVEPFCGGAAVFFAKGPSRVECLNDLNGELVNFYRVFKTRFDKLNEKCQATLYARSEHARASSIYRNPTDFDEVERAWALWVLGGMGFSGELTGGWGYGASNTSKVAAFRGKKKRMSECSKRLEGVQLECSDALKVIKVWDRDYTFFYVDPPYVGSDQGHYSGYTEEDFHNLLLSLEGIKGKFMLSSYPHEILSEFTERNGWRQINIEQEVVANRRPGSPPAKIKTEVITMNYAAPNSLF